MPKRPPKKPNQIVLRVTDALMAKIADLIRWSGFEVKRTQIIERAVNELHSNLKGKQK